MAKACKIIKNQNGSPIGVADSNGNPSKIFKQITQIPFLRNFDEAVNTYTYLKGKIPSLDEVTQQLQKTGLAKKVHTLSPQQIEQELIKRGVDAKLAKQVSVWHGSPHLFDKFSLSAIGTGEGNQAFGWGLYFTDLESIAREYADKLRPNILLIDGKTYYEVRNEIDNPVISWLESYVRDGLNKGEIITKLNEQLEDKEWLSKNTWVEKNINEVLDYIKDKTIEEDKSNRNLYKTTLHKGKQPSEYTWLEWDKEISKEQIIDIFNKLGKEQDNDQANIDYEVENYLRFEERTGEGIYEYLSNQLGSPKEASLFLLRAGIDGIKYPAESISRGATSDTARGFNYVVFDENAITVEEVIQFQKAGIGVLPNGFVDLKTKEVFLNQETANLDTPIHEFSHLYTNLLKQTNPDLYKKGLELIEKEGQEYINFVKQNQPNLEGEALLEEALTQAVGEAGAKIINKQSSFFQWLQDMWNSLKDMLGLSQYSWDEVRNMSLQEYTDAIAIDLLRGEELRPSPILSTEQELQQIKQEAIANGTFMKAPNGKDTNLNERQWLQVRSKNFRDWFGDWINDPQNASKVVDPNGEPLVVYHGSGANFTVFNEKQTNNSGYGGYYQDVAFFTDDKKVAENFAGENGKVYEVFLNIKNPYYRDGRFLSPTAKLEYEDDSNDGIIITNADTGAGIATEYLIDTEEFSPNQIKSATDNVGTFSAQSDDIRYQIIGEQGAKRIEQYKNSLDEAKKLESEGVSYAEIESKTKWYKFKGNWRMLSPELIKSFKIQRREENTELTLKEVLGNENSIFKVYPEISKIKVVFYNPTLPIENIKVPEGIEESNGAYIQEDEVIFINTGIQTRDAQLYTLAHEVQHVIQEIEGHPTGGGLNSVLYETIKILNIPTETETGSSLKYLVDFIKKADVSNLTENQRNIVKDSLNTLEFIASGDRDGLFRQYRHILGEIDSKIVEGALTIRDNQGAIPTSYKELLEMYSIGYNVDLNKTYLLSNGDISYQISGERGITNLEDRIEAARRLKNLETAKEMHASGISPLRIKQATEWEINPVDNKWRYEIADGNIKLNSLEIGREYPLSEVIEGTEFTEMYPDISVKIIDNDEVRLSGRYNRETKTIEINANFGEWVSLKEGGLLGVSDRLRQTLLHEMAHAAQNEEGFAGGGSPKLIIDETIKRLGITPNDSKQSSKEKAEKVLYNPESSQTDKILAQYMLDVLASSSKTAAIEIAETYYPRIVGEAEANAVVNRSRGENAFEEIFPGNRLQSLIYESGDVAIEDQIYFESIYPKVMENRRLQFRDKDGNVYNSLKEMLDNNVEDFKIGIEHEGKFISAIEAQISPNPQTVNGLIMSLIKDGLISDKATLDTNGEILLVPTGESDLKKAITSDMARGIAKGYQGNIFKIGKDFNIRIQEQEKAKDSHNKSFQQLKREVGEDEAVERKTLQEYSKFIGESNRRASNQDLDFSMLPDNELTTRLLSYLNKIGVSTTSIEQYVKKYQLKNGVHPDAQALADLSNNIIAFKDGIITEAELTEEVSHFIVDSMNQQEKENLMSNIHRTAEWGEYAQTYYDVYSQQGLSGQELENAVREEILGKVLAASLKENFQREQNNTIEGGIVARLRQAFNNFFERIRNFFKDSYQTELERYTYNVYENLMNETLPSEQRDGNKSKLTLYSTNRVTPLQKATKSWLETLNATQRELKGKYKLSSSSNTLARQIRNMQGQIDDATYKNAIADLLSVTNSQINLVEREVTKALKEGYYFPQEIKGAYESIRSTLQPIIAQVEGTLNPKDSRDKQLLEEIDKTSKNIRRLTANVPNVNKKALENVLERVFRQNNFTQEEIDKYREQVSNVLKRAEYDTSWFHAHLGGLLQARHPLLNLLGDVIEQMKFRERQLLAPKLKDFMTKLEQSGYDVLKLKNLIYKNEIINEVDPEKAKVFENEIKAKWYNTYVLEGERATQKTVEEKIKAIEDEVNTLTDEIENKSNQFTAQEIQQKQSKRSENNLILSQIDKSSRKEISDKKYISMIDPKFIEQRDNFPIEVNGQTVSRATGVIPGISVEEAQVYVDDFDQISRQIWEIKNLADGGELTKSEQKEIRDIEARRRALMNPRGLDGKLKPGIEENWDSKLRTFTYSVNLSNLNIEDYNEALRVVAFQNLSLLSQKFAEKQSGERGGIPQTFFDALDSYQTEQEKLDFLMNNSTISFPQEFWDSFDPNKSLVVKLLALKNGSNDSEIDGIIDRIRSNQAKISNIIKSNRDFFNPAETDVEDFLQQTEVRDAQTELDKAKAEARKLFPEGTQFDVTDGVDISANESYIKKLADLGIKDVEAEFNFARKHMTPKAEDAIISLRNIIKRLEKGETVSKSYFTEQVIGSRTDYDNILREEIRKRLLPYYKRTEPSGYSQALERMNQGVEDNIPNSVMDFINSGFVEVKPSNAFYDSTSRLNPEWVANKEAGREQYKKDYLKEVRNDEYFNRYNPNSNGEATTNVAEFKARQAWLEMNDYALELYGLTGLQSRYQLPQQHKTVIRRLATSKGKPKSLLEMVRDATTIREDDMELGQNVFGEKAKKGDTLLTVPRYGVNKLKNQDDVSDEILQSVIWFTQQAALYKARKEGISEALALRDFIIYKEDYAGKEDKSSNTFKMADSFINANFYGVKETFSYEIDVPHLGKINIGKIARTFNNWVRFSNLAGVTVPLTSMLQGKIQEAVEAAAKEATSPTAYKLAQQKVAKLLPRASREIMGFHSKSELNSKLEILGVYNMLDRFNNSNLNKGWRTALAANNGLHQLGNAPVTSTAAFSVILDYRVVDGRIMTERQYKSIFKNAKDWESYPLFDNFWKIDKNGKSTIDKNGLKQALGITNEQEVDRIAEETLETISKRALALIQRVDTQIPEHQKSMASRNAIANFFLMHLNWFLVAIPNKTKFKHNNLAEGGMVQEGNWRTVLNVISKMVQNPKNYKQIWNDAKTDDLQKRALRRTAVEFTVGNAIAIAAILLANAVDDDDDPAYLLTWADYMLTRVAVEQVSGTIALPQQVDEIISNPLVSYQRLKDLSELPNLVFGDEIITQGSYAGRTTRFRAAAKNLPFVREIRRFSDFTRERETYAYFQVNEKGLFRNYAWLSNLAVEELDEE